MLELLSQEEDNEEDGEEDLDLERGELLLLKADLLILKENMKSSIERRFRRAENPVYVLATSLDIRWKGTSSFITNPDEFKTAIENFDRALKQRMTTMRTTTNQRTKSIVRSILRKVCRRRNQLVLFLQEIRKNRLKLPLC
jgi:hypothetical protein